MYHMEKMALEAVLFIHEYCDRTDCCDDCVFYDKYRDKTSDGCRIKRFFSPETYNYCKKKVGGNV